jgi:IS30 family transposase
VHRTRRPFSDEDLSNIWGRWRRGESISDIGRALGKKAATIFGVLALHGGVAPVRRTVSELALGLVEREEISIGLAQGDSLRAIARRLGRAPSTISREVRRNGGRGCYRASVATARARAEAKRPKTCKLAANPRLKNYVSARLELRWSPEQIAGWLRREYAAQPEMCVSHETIYRSLYRRAKGPFGCDLVRHLRSRRVMRRARTSTRAGQARGQIVGAVSIRDRPAVIERRQQFGHWEGDLISGAMNSHIATLVERRSRATLLVRVRGKSADAVASALAMALKRLPKRLRRSLTWDRGSELARHAWLTKVTGARVYFCDPQSPWQRGTNENTNGLLRQYFPKGTRLDGFSQRELDAVARSLNGRPRKLLGFGTPAVSLRKALQ